MLRNGFFFFFTNFLHFYAKDLFRSSCARINHRTHESKLKRHSLLWTSRDIRHRFDDKRSRGKDSIRSSPLRCTPTGIQEKDRAYTNNNILTPYRVYGKNYILHNTQHDDNIANCIIYYHTNVNRIVTITTYYMYIIILSLLQYCVCFKG